MKAEILQLVLKHYGSQRALARALCISEGAVSHWIKDGWFPADRAIQIERAIGSKKVKAVDLAK